ncbi:MAG: PEP-CTERM sorting domain-containing protein [Burkholderiaceae bacterium]|nr:PEP-CTERM sorting domain-containing protein [Burkholderiaceae bacterium]
MKNLIIAALISMPFFPAAANLVTNGSFEATPQASGTWGVYGSLPGWTGIGSGIELRDNVAGTALDGKNFVELDSYGNSSMTQALSGIAGEYLLSFWYSARPGTGAQTNGLSFSLDGIDLGSVLLDTGNPNNDHLWQHYTSLVNFDGLGDLRFNAIGASDSYGGSLDKIEFTAADAQLRISAAVPEPGTIALALAGLAAAGFASRRQNKLTPRQY